MSLPLIAAGLADPDVVDIHIGRSMSAAAVRALAGEVEAHAREASALQQRPEYMQPEDPSVLLAAWTRARGHCGDNSEDARHRWAVEEHAEEEQRLRELERVLQEQQPSR